MNLHHYSWSENQLEYIQRCINAHGHHLVWENSESIKIKVASMSGMIPFIKGVEKYFQHKVILEISPRKEHIRFFDLVDKGSVGTYDQGDIKFRLNAKTSVSKNHKATFNFVKKIGTWTVLDTVYFFGQALTTYFSIPSILPRLELIGECIADVKGEKLRGFKVKFPNDFNTHCKIQTFYFDSNYLLRRHDYSVDIISPPAYGSHFTTNYIEHNNILIAAKRTVYARFRQNVLPVKVLEADIEV